LQKENEIWRGGEGKGGGKNPKVKTPLKGRKVKTFLAAGGKDELDIRERSPFHKPT